MLKAGSSWPGFRGNADALTIGVGSVNTTFDFEKVPRAATPPLPPDSLPAWVYADTNVIDGGNVVFGGLAKNAIVVGFEVGTSVAARTAALARVGGTVIGGIRADTAEGFYFVRPTRGASARDLLDAADTVATMPGVVLAVPAIAGEIGADYRRPFDGPTARQWQLSPDSADGDNWALEHIAAPYAWGCATGDSATRSGVVDLGFQAIPDLTPNVRGSPRYSSPANYHGTAVASILAARGDNGDGIAGVMWQADLRLEERSATDVEAFARVGGVMRDLIRMTALVANGARVINLSGNPFFDGAGVIPVTAAGAARVEIVRKMMRWVLRLGNNRPNAPVFVLSAGNQQRDAYYNGYPAIALDYPTRVLVVGAVALHETTLDRSYSNFGPLIKVVAPGTNLQTLDPAGQPRIGFTGTSGATPLVAGVAGLLASFDPRLSAADIHDLVIAGAVAGGRTADGFPVLNAYESLKLAARRPGAPLCGGQRVWIENHNVYVARDTASAPELLAALGAPAWGLDVYHGGKWIDYQTQSGYHSLRYSNGHWEPTTEHNVTDYPGGAYSSSQGRAHESWSHFDVHTRLGDSRSNSISPDSELVTIVLTDSVGCEDSTMVMLPAGRVDHRASTWMAPRAYPQRGHIGLVGLSRMREDVTRRSEFCLDDRSVPTTCTIVSSRIVPDTSYLFTIDVSGPRPRLQLQRLLPDTLIYSLARLDDDLRTLVSLGGAHTVPGGSDLALDWCVMQERDAVAGGQATRSVAGADACPSPWVTFDALTGGFSAFRAAMQSTVRSSNDYGLLRAAPPDGGSVRAAPR